jgi:hypothetical protein
MQFLKRNLPLYYYFEDQFNINFINHLFAKNKSFQTYQEIVFNLPWM